MVALLSFVLCLQAACGQKKPNVDTANSTTTATPAVAAAPQQDYGKLRIQAKSLMEAFVRGDFEQFAALTYPKLIEKIGGRERMIESISEEVKTYEAQGFKIVSFNAHDPTDSVRIGQQFFVVMPTTMIMKTSTGNGTSESFFIGISEDNGSNWTFIDGSGGLSKEKLRLLFDPAVADRLSALRFPEVKTTAPK